MPAESASAEQRLAREAVERFPAEAAPLFEEAAPEESARLIGALPQRTAAAALERLTLDSASRVFKAMPAELAGPLLAAVDPPWAASMLLGLDTTSQERLLDGLDDRAAGELRQLMVYPPDSAGSLMDPRVLSLRRQTTVAQTLIRLRAFRDKRVRRVYVIDDDGLLIGSARLQDIAMAGPAERLLDLMDQRPVSVLDMASREEVVDLLTRSKLASLPVVDLHGRLLGVIRDDLLLAVTREEATADIQSMVGASREERALSPVGFAVRKRLPWLEINLATAFLAAAVVGLFEDTIARFTALAVLLPVVAGQSGNTGAQALAVTMRGLALREVRVRHWLRVAVKEVRVAFFNGLAVSLTTSAAVFVWSRSLGLTLVIGVSMVLSMVAAGLAGAGIPMLLTAAKQDPAQSSSIILTTVTDVVGFFSFLGIATLLSGMI